MDNANDFFSKLGENFKNDINVSLTGRVVSVKGSKLDVQPFAELPLLVDLDTVHFPVQEGLIVPEYKAGDIVVVVFNNYNENGIKDNGLSNGIVIGAISGRESMTLKDYIERSV